MAAVSPTILPQHSLHSVSGTISIALGIHGPNYGAGGGCGALGEGLLCAVTLMANGTLPGIWLVLTEWNPEPIPDEGNAHDVGDATCHALAIALSCRHQQDESQLLRLFPGESLAIPVVLPPVLSNQTTVIELARMLDVEYQNRSTEHRSQLATRSTANECDDRKAA